MTEPLADFFQKAGPLPPSLKDVRRFPRFYFRSVAEADIYSVGNESKATRRFVLTCDLSRGGISILHNEQLFPGQRIALTLNGEPPRNCVVERCKRQDKGIYAIGCRFVSDFAG